MTRDEIMNLDEKGIETRKGEILAEIAGADAERMTELEAEVATIEERIAALNTEHRKEAMKKVAGGAGKKIKREGNEMNMKEFRNSKEYVDAYARYIRTGRDEECRALFSANVDSNEVSTAITIFSGPVPVPDIVEQTIRTAWERSTLMNLVRKTYLRGNIRVGFELSADGAAIHYEGADAPTEEELLLGIVTITPYSIKKWITISDEAVDLGGEEFLRYVYDELTYRIAAKAQEILLGMIATASTTASTTAVGVAEIESDGSDMLSVVADAYAHLSPEARNPVIVMNKLTHAQFRAAQSSAGYAFDPYEGLPVYYDSTLGTVGQSSIPWLIVGDFGIGAQANFPNGDEVKIVYDNLSLAEQDLVKLVGREYVGIGLVADQAFCRVISTT